MKQKTKTTTKTQAKVQVKAGKNPWQVHLGKVFADMKKKNTATKLSEAMKAAKKTYTCKNKK